MYDKAKYVILKISKLRLVTKPRARLARLTIEHLQALPVQYSTLPSANPRLIKGTDALESFR